MDLDLLEIKLYKELRKAFIDKNFNKEIGPQFKDKDNYYNYLLNIDSRICSSILGIKILAFYEKLFNKELENEDL